MAMEPSLESEVRKFGESFELVETELSRVIVGVKEQLRTTLGAIFAGGHVLLEGMPGLGKTLLVKSLAQSLGLSFKRVQFTPDLMPSDVTGTQILSEDDHGKRRFEFKPGPLFANIVLADEINRTTPKTQAALLEAMEERQITVLDATYPLPKPFFVLATQNPIELEGTYPLPEAQLDRFMVKLLLKAPSAEELKEVLTRTTGGQVTVIKPLFSHAEASAEIDRMRNLVRRVVVSEPLMAVLVRMVCALSPGDKYASEKVRKYVKFGPGPRGAQAVMLLAKVFALFDGRINLALEDIRAALLPTLRHRVIMNFQAEADSVSSDVLLSEIKNAK